MNLFKRIKNSVAADLHDLLDQKEQKNPVTTLNQYLRQCEAEVEKMGKLIERQYLLKDEFQREYDRAKAMAEKRKNQAEIAKEAGETELYEVALQDQLYFEERANRMDEARNTAKTQLEALERKYAEMQHKLKDMQLKRLELMGRENIARAYYQANKVLNSADLESPHSRFKELESYMERIEHRVDTAYYRNTLDARIQQLEKDLKKEAQ